MGYSNGNISAPVSVYDVQQCCWVRLQRTVSGQQRTIYSGDVGVLCGAKIGDTIPASDGLGSWTVTARGAVNKWARFKPVKWAYIDTTGQLNQDKTWNTGVLHPWWKATQDNCGISFVTSLTTVAQVKAAIDNKDAIWTYDPPTGGASEPYRLIDFNQYCHTAIPPVFGLYVGTAILQPGAKWKIGIIAGITGLENITFGDFPALANYYFTVAVYNELGTQLKMLYSSPKKMNEIRTTTDLEFEIPFSDYGTIFTNGTTYKLYGFLTTYKYSGGTVENQSTYIPLPNENETWGAQPTTFQAVTSSVVAAVEAWQLMSGGRIIYWAVYVYNCTSSGISGAYIQLVDLNGNVLQQHTINVVNDIPSSNPHYISGVQNQKFAETGTSVALTFTLPDDNFDQYKVKFIGGGATASAPIAYDIQPEE